MKTSMEVILLNNTPLSICAKAIRKCWASEVKSDSYKGCPECGSHVVTEDNIDSYDYLGSDDHQLPYRNDLKSYDAVCLNCDLLIRHKEMLINICGEKDKDLIKRVGIKNNHSSVLRHLNYTFEINNIDTKSVLAFTRHKAGVDFSIQSTRFTVKKRKDDISYTPTGDNRIDTKLDDIMELVREAINEGISNDAISMLLPSAYNYSLIVTMNAQAIRHFLNLRSKKEAHINIQKVAYSLFNAIPRNHRYLFEDCL